MSKVMSVTNKWKVLEDQILGQAWIDYKFVFMGRDTYMDNIGNS